MKKRSAYCGALFLNNQLIGVLFTNFLHIPTPLDNKYNVVVKYKQSSVVIRFMLNMYSIFGLEDIKGELWIIQ